MRVEGNIATVGITDFAQGELGDIVYVEIETKGDKIEESKVFGSVEAVKTVSDLYMPVSGTIMEVNPDLEDNPELVNDSPYENGWMIKIEMNDPGQLENLLSADDYQAVVE